MARVGILCRKLLGTLDFEDNVQGGTAMPLLDHFHPPISERRNWEGFHGLWASALVERLKRDVLADEYFADMQVHIGSQVEVDVATLR